MRGRHPGLQPFADIGALLDFQHRTDGCHVRHDEILRALAMEVAHRGPASSTAHVVLMLALWPGLDAIYNRLRRFYRTALTTLAADISGAIATGISRLDLAEVNRIASTLVRNVERDLRRGLQREHRHADHDELPDDLAGAWGPADAGLLEADLRQVIGSDAEIVVAVAIDREPQDELAARLGLGYAALRKRYQRALHRLREAVRAD